MSDHPVTIQVAPATEQRNRLTTFFRFFLALPHLILVGGPAAIGAGFGVSWSDHGSWRGTGGLIGLCVLLTTVAMWFIIVITATHPEPFWRFGAWYMRWRVRALSYLMLLRDEYPPFGDGDGDYPAQLSLGAEPQERDRLTAFVRILLALPHLIILAVLSLLWAFTTAIAWVVILVTGRYPETLYGFALGVFAWSTRVEAYVLLLRDEYPPFTLRV